MDRRPPIVIPTLKKKDFPGLEEGALLEVGPAKLGEIDVTWVEWPLPSSGSAFLADSNPEGVAAFNVPPYISQQFRTEKDLHKYLEGRLRAHHKSLKR